MLTFEHLFQVILCFRRQPFRQIVNLLQINRTITKPKLKNRTFTIATVFTDIELLRAYNVHAPGHGIIMLCYLLIILPHVSGSIWINLLILTPQFLYSEQDIRRSTFFVAGNQCNTTLQCLPQSSNLVHEQDFVKHGQSYTVGLSEMVAPLREYKPVLGTEPDHHITFNLQ